MAFTVFLGNLPVWVTADDITAWLTAENLVADSIKVIRNPETQESKGFAFIEAPNQEEMDSIIRRFDRAPLEDRLLRANPAQPPKRAGGPPMAGAPMGSRPPMSGGFRDRAQAGGENRGEGRPAADGAAGGAQSAARKRTARPAGAGGPNNKRRANDGPPSAFAEELAKAL